MQLSNNRRFHQRALSYIELLKVITIIGLLSAVAIGVYTNLTPSVQDQKLRSDVVTLNNAVSAYLNSGGDLSEAKTVEAVIAKLKTIADEQSRSTVAGMKGSFVDARLKPVMQTRKEAKEEGRLLVFWNADDRRFYLSSDKGDESGVKEFVLDDALAENHKPVEETRDVGTKLARNDAWVWDYEKISDVVTAPSIDDLGTVPSDIPDTPSPPSSRTQLVPPVFGVPSTKFPITDYPMTLGSLELADANNPQGGGDIFVSVNGADWQSFEAGLEIPPGAQVAAFVSSRDPDSYISSFATSEWYDAEPVQLDPPNIVASHRVIGYEERNYSSLVTLKSDVPEDIAVLSYSTDDGQTWNSYDSPFRVDISAFPSGAMIQAKTTAIIYEKYYLESEAVSLRIKAQLKAPEFSLASLSCCEDLYDKTLNLIDPNESADSQIMVSIDEAPFAKYTGTITIPGNTKVSAYIQSESPNWVTSLTESHNYEALPITPLAAPVITPGGGIFNDSVLLMIEATGEVPEGSRIVFTVDGTDPGVGENGEPTNGTLYTGPVELLHKPTQERSGSGKGYTLDWASDDWNDGEGWIDSLWYVPQTIRNIGGSGVDATVTAVNGSPSGWYDDSPSISDDFYPLGSGDALKSNASASSDFYYSITFSEEIQLEDLATGGQYIYGGVQGANRIDVFDDEGNQIDLTLDQVSDSDNASVSINQGGIETRGTHNYSWWSDMDDLSSTFYEFGGLGVNEIRWNHYGYSGGGSYSGGSSSPGKNDVTSFTLINAVTDQPISGYDPITPGSTINLAALPTSSLNIRANTDTTGSVRFGWNGSYSYSVQNYAPFAIGGQSGGNYWGWNLPVGEHTLTARGHSGNHGNGYAGESLTINFRVVDSTDAKYVSGFSLVDGSTGSVIAGYENLSNASTINLDEISSGTLGLRANTYGLPRSVKFTMDGSDLGSVNSHPYTFIGAAPSVGSYTFTATPYSQENGTGTAGYGASVDLTFTSSKVGHSGASYLSNITFERLSSPPTPYTVIARVYPPLGSEHCHSASEPAKEEFTVQSGEAFDPVYLDPPLIQPSGGDFMIDVSVKMSLPENAPADARIYYSEDGGTPGVDAYGNPTSGTLYSGPFTLSNPNGVGGQTLVKTIKARVFPPEKDLVNYIAGDPAEAVFRIDAQKQLQPPTITLVGTTVGGNQGQGHGSSNGDGNGKKGFLAQVDVTLALPSGAPSGAQIYYTINGADPGVGSNGAPKDGTLYTGTFPISYAGIAGMSEDFVIRARVYPPSGQSKAYMTSSMAQDSFVLEDLRLSGSSDGVFKRPYGDDHLVTNINPGRSNSYFEWGDPAPGFSSGNYLNFTGANFDEIGPDDVFSLGSINYFNSSTYQGTNATSVTLAITLDIDTPNRITSTFDFSLDLESTVNNLYSKDADADYVRFGNLYTDFNTVLGGQQYYLNLQFGYVGSQGYSTIDEFHVHEGVGVSAELLGYFSTNPMER